MSRTGLDWLAWWQLLRAANVFTAMSNVIAGFLLVQRDWQPLGPLLLLILASVCLYEAGMVLNDVFDAELDAVERPERPIPSGRISKQHATGLGVVLLLGGIASAVLVSWQSSTIAINLAVMILVYDAIFKSTPWGPYAMGACRVLNVMLGASVATSLARGEAGAWLLGWGVGLHTVGLTIIARSEAGSANKSELRTGAAVVLASLCMIAILPTLVDNFAIPVGAWIGICALLLVVEVSLIRKLLTDPSQSVIRRTVGALITLFLPLDAAACALAAGWWAGFCVLLLLVPVRLLSRWTGQT